MCILRSAHCWGLVCPICYGLVIVLNVVWEILRLPMDSSHSNWFQRSHSLYVGSAVILLALAQRVTRGNDNLVHLGTNIGM